MTAKKTTSPPLATSEEALQKELERTDRDLARLLRDRAKTAARLAKVRQAAGAPTFDLVEEDRLLARFVEVQKGLADQDSLRQIYREVLSSQRALLTPLRIGYLGPKYTYSHLAAMQRFGDSPQLTPLASIKGVFQALHQQQIEYGVVPLENSTDGRIVDTLDMFARLPTQITAEVPLRIHHYLLGKCSRADILEVYSKPQPFSQCREWLAQNLPQVKLIETTSTTAAVQLAAEKPGAAAIASREAGLHYGLAVIDANLEDNPENLTRFAVIGGPATKRTGKDKTALMFAIPHQPGALADAMLIFKKGELNMTWIESFPMPGCKNEYLFFVELEGHQTDRPLKSALEALAKKTVRLEILGSYAKGEPAA